MIAEGEPTEVLMKRLRDLELLGLVKDNKLTSKGEELVTVILHRPLTLRGTVVSGEGEGGYYLSLEGYRKQIKGKLGFEPYPGTLNLLLTPESLEKRALIYLRKAITISGFEEGGRRYGEVLAYPAQVNSFWPAAIIIPLKTHHPPSIVEVIAPVKLRDKLSLKDGDPVSLKVL